MKYLILGALPFLALAGCQSAASPEGTYDSSAHVWRTDHGDIAQDRVSGETVDVSKAVKREYDGETYYFANEDHAREFLAHPEKYEYTNSPDTPDYPAR
jgi:YHS domain-containing protein